MSGEVLDLAERLVNRGVWFTLLGYNQRTQAFDAALPFRKIPGPGWDAEPPVAAAVAAHVAAGFPIGWRPAEEVDLCVVDVDRRDGEWKVAPDRVAKAFGEPLLRWRTPNGEHLLYQSGANGAAQHCVKFRGGEMRLHGNTALHCDLHADGAAGRLRDLCYAVETEAAAVSPDDLPKVDPSMRPASRPARRRDTEPGGETGPIGPVSHAGADPERRFRKDPDRTARRCREALDSMDCEYEPGDYNDWTAVALALIRGEKGGDLAEGEAWNIWAEWSDKSDKWCDGKEDPRRVWERLCRAEPPKGRKPIGLGSILRFAPKAVPGAVLNDVVPGVTSVSNCVMLFGRKDDDASRKDDEGGAIHEDGRRVGEVLETGPGDRRVQPSGGVGAERAGEGGAGVWSACGRGGAPDTGGMQDSPAGAADACPACAAMRRMGVLGEGETCAACETGIPMQEEQDDHVDMQQVRVRAGVRVAG